MNCSELFGKCFGAYPEGEVFCPYRICPLGAHTDHNLGLVTGFAINEGITIAYAADRSGKVTAASAQFEGMAGFCLNDIPNVRCGDWADYLRGAAKALKSRYGIEAGAKVFISGSLPVGGLSSSAAVTLAFINALCRVNGLALSENEYMEIALEAEMEYVGVKCGTLDQSCELYCRENRLLFLDTLTGEKRLISMPCNAPELDIAVFFSGKEHSLAKSGYNMRTDELRSAAYSIKAFAGMEYGRFSETNMREVSREDFEKYSHLLPENFRKRAEHWYSECERVKDGVTAFESGDIEKFGSLMNESGKSSINLWQTGSDELKALTAILAETDGVYGARFSGAGFSGCCAALTDPKKREKIEYKVKSEYTRLFPQLEGAFISRFCESADAMKI